MHRAFPATLLFLCLSILSFGPLSIKAQIIGSSSPQNRIDSPSPNTTAPRRPSLTCSPAPCVLPNVQLSTGPSNSTVIATSPLNPSDLIAASYVNDVCDWGAAYSSTNGGTSWSASCPSGDIAYLGDPAVAYGRTAEYLAGTSGAVDGAILYITSSTNNGAHWSQAVEVTGGILPAGLPNAPWIAIDNTKSRPFANTIYVSATQFDYPPVESEIAVSYSTNGGKTWTTNTVDPVQIKPEVDQFSRPAVASDGTVYLTWLRCAATGEDITCADTLADIFFSKSTDGGSTWSTPAQIATTQLVTNTCNCASAYFGNLPNTFEPVSDDPVIAIDSSTGAHAGNLYVVMYNWTGTQMQVQVITSTDQGATWSKPVQVAPASATHDQFFASIAVSSSGMVGVSWLDRRNDPLNVSYQPFAAVSSNGGASFGSNYQLATNLSNPYLDGNEGTYMGDYTGSSWSANEFLFTWPDTRNMVMDDYLGGVLMK
jgi:hypothetical protein